MLNSEYRSMLDFENRGNVLSGIIENPAGKINVLLLQIHEIVGDYLYKYGIDSDLFVIENHWIVFNHISKYWGIYYKEGHECIIDTRPANSGCNNKRFINQ